MSFTSLITRGLSSLFEVFVYTVRSELAPISNTAATMTNEYEFGLPDRPVITKHQNVRKSGFDRGLVCYFEF